MPKLSKAINYGAPSTRIWEHLHIRVLPTVSQAYGFGTFFRVYFAWVFLMLFSYFTSDKVESDLYIWRDSSFLL